MEVDLHYGRKTGGWLGMLSSTNVESYSHL